VRRAIDLAGKEYGRWTVRRADPDRPRHWVCLCDPARGGCGVEASVHGGSLRGGKSTQCLACAGKSKFDGRPDRIARFAAGQKASGDGVRARYGLPPLAPGRTPLRRRGRLGLPTLRGLCDRAESEGWDAARLIREIRELAT
jgi:hypothetical protein